jgi:phosphate/sulfate permease
MTKLRWLWYQVMAASGGQDANVSIENVIKNELRTLHETLNIEKSLFLFFLRSEKEKSRRLLYLFQKDLLPGINGMILEGKKNRENSLIPGASTTAKIVSWISIGIANIGMLFYIFLFAIQQSSHKQQAWGQSFAIYLVIDILVVGTLIVLVMHVLIPSLSMRDIQAIQKKLSEAVNCYQIQLKQGSKYNPVQYEDELLHLPIVKAVDSGKLEEKSSNSEFNAAKYLFLSTHLASYYSDLLVSKIILSFTSPWPKQSYQYLSKVTSGYEQSSSGFMRAFSIILLFFLSSLLSMPISVQDMIMNCVSTVVTGYGIILHYQLYHISPALVIIPVIVGGFLAYLVYRYVTRKSISEVKPEIMATLVNEEVPCDPKDYSTVSSDHNQNVPHHPVVVTAQADISHHVTRRASVQQGIEVAHLAASVLEKKERDEEAKSTIMISNVKNLSSISSSDLGSLDSDSFTSISVKDDVPAQKNQIRSLRSSALIDEIKITSPKTMGQKESDRDQLLKTKEKQKEDLSFSFDLSDVDFDELFSSEEENN